MITNNRTPRISRTAQDVRDNDFITIVEVKQFDDVINDILKKISAISDSSEKNSSSEAESILLEMKKITWNMADALDRDEDGNIIEFKSKEEGEFIVPVDGPDSMSLMLNKLNELYSQFTKLVGQDKISGWKIEIDDYFVEAFQSFTSLIGAIFKRSATTIAIETKNVEDIDYLKNSTPILEEDSILRLNPDITAVTKNIGIMLKKPNVETVIFEVSELETDNLVLGLKFMNGANYISYNVIVDNGELFITQDESFKLGTDNYEIKIHKFTTNLGINQYIFTLTSDSQIANIEYLFELEGILIRNYNFSKSGMDFASHDEYENCRELKTININGNDDNSGTVGSDNVDIDGDNFIDNKLPMVFEDVKNNATIKAIDVNIESAELFTIEDTEADKNNKFIFEEDKSIKFFKKPNEEEAFIKRMKAKAIDNKLAIAAGNDAYFLTTINPKSARHIVNNVTKPDSTISNDLDLVFDDLSIDNGDGVYSLFRNGVSSSNGLFPRKMVELLEGNDGSHIIDNVCYLTFEGVKYLFVNYFQDFIFENSEMNMESEDKLMLDHSIFKFDSKNNMWISATVNNPMKYLSGNSVSDAQNSIKLINNEVYVCMSTELNKYVVELKKGNIFDNLLLKLNKDNGIFEDIHTINNEDIAFSDSICGIGNGGMFGSINGDEQILVIVKVDGGDYEIWYNGTESTMIVPEYVDSVKDAVNEVFDKPTLKVISNHRISLVNTTNGELMYSHNSEIWSLHNEFLDKKIKDMYYDGYRNFFVICEDESVYGSDTGFNWKKVEGIPENFKINKIVNTGYDSNFVLMYQENDDEELEYDVKSIMIKIDDNLELTSYYKEFPGDNLSDLVHNKIVYVLATSNNRHLYSSDDGENFELRNKLFICTTGSKINYSSNLINWSSSYRSPTTGLYGNIIFEDGMFITVGSTSETASIIFYSYDLISWFTKSITTTSKLRSIVKFKNKYVTSSENGDIFQSSDSKITSSYTKTISGGKGGSRLFVDADTLILIGLNKASKSTNGVAWTTVTVPNVVELYGIFKDENGSYIIAGGHVNTGYILRSQDLVTFDEIYRGTFGIIIDIYKIDGYYYIHGFNNANIGYMKRSTDLQNWEDVYPEDPVKSRPYGMLIIDLSEHFSINSKLAVYDRYNIVEYGESGLNVCSTGEDITVNSSNYNVSVGAATLPGKLWINKSKDPISHVEMCTTDNGGTFNEPPVIVASRPNNTHLYSIDNGGTWTEGYQMTTVSDLENPTEPIRINKVKYIGDVGDMKTVALTNHGMMYSDNRGRNFKRCTIRPYNVPKRYIGGGYDGKITFSEDLENWTTIGVDATSIYNIRKLNNIYFGCSYNDGEGISNLSISYDLINWEIVLASTNGVIDICYGNGYYVASSKNKIMYTIDLINWTTIATGNNIHGCVRFVDGLFIATSRDNYWYAYTWNMNNWYNVALGGNWRDVVLGENNSLYMCGNAGRLAYSLPNHVGSVTDWYSFSSSVIANWWRIKYINGIYLLVADNGYVAHGIDVEKLNIITLAGQWYDIDYDIDTGTYIIFGNVHSSGIGMIATSKDLFNWEVKDAPVSFMSGFIDPGVETTGEFTDIEYSNDTDFINFKFIATSPQGLFYSKDCMIFYSAKELIHNHHKTNFSELSVLDDIHLIGSNNVLAPNNKNFLQFDRFDKIWTENVLTAKRNTVFMKNTSFGVFIGTDSSLIRSTFSQGDDEIFNFQFVNLFETSHSLFGIDTNKNIFRYDSNSDDFVPFNIDNLPTDESSSGIINILETPHSLIFLTKNQIFNLYDLDLTNEIHHLVLTDTADVIDCVYIDNNNTLVSSVFNADDSGEQVQYHFDVNSKVYTRNTITIQDTNDQISFDKVFKFNGELFIYNGSGSNTNVSKIGYCKLVNRGDGFYYTNFGATPYGTRDEDDTELITGTELFEFNNKLFAIGNFTSGIDSDKSNIYEYIEFGTTFEFRLVSELSNKPIFDMVQKAKDKNGRFIVQGISDIKHEKINIFDIGKFTSSSSENEFYDYNHDNFKTDYFYFDNIGNKKVSDLISDPSGKFELFKDTTSIGLTTNTRKFNLAFALGIDAKIAIYDKSYNFLKVSKFKFSALKLNLIEDYYLNIDDSFDISKVFIGSGSSENYLYFTANGIFSNVEYDAFGGTIVVKETESSIRMFKVLISDIMKSDDLEETIIVNWVKSVNSEDDEVIRNHIIENDNLKIIEDSEIIMETKDNKQLIYIGDDVIKNNISSVVIFNNTHKRLEIISGINWSTKLKYKDGVKPSATNNVIKKKRYFISETDEMDCGLEPICFDRIYVTGDWFGGFGGNGYFIYFTSKNNTIAYTNAGTPETTPTTLTVTGTHRCGIYHNNRYIIAGEGGVSVCTAAAPTSFTRYTVTGIWYRIIHDGEKYVMVSHVSSGANGQIATSTNLSSWNTTTLTNGLSGKDMIFVNGKYIIVNYGFIGYSEDLVNWTKVDISASNDGYRCVRYDETRKIYIICGGNNIAYSKDLNNWKVLTYPQITNIRSCEIVVSDFLFFGTDSKYLCGKDLENLKVETFLNPISHVYDTFQYKDVLCVPGANRLYYSRPREEIVEVAIGTTDVYSGTTKTTEVKPLKLTEKFAGPTNKYRFSHQIGKKIFHYGQNYTYSMLNSDPNSLSKILNLPLKQNVHAIADTSFGGIGTDHESNMNLKNGSCTLILDNDNFEMDPFTNIGDRHYTRAKETDLGLFRWNNYNDNIFYKPNEYKHKSEDESTGWIYYKPKNTNKVFVIDPGPFKWVTNIYNISVGTFLAIADYQWYGVQPITSYSLYLMTTQPDLNSGIDRILLEDTRYFTRKECEDMEIQHMFDSVNGLFSINKLEIYTRVFRWSGDDFYLIYEREDPYFDRYQTRSTNYRTIGKLQMWGSIVPFYQDRGAGNININTTINPVPDPRMIYTVNDTSNSGKHYIDRSLLPKPQIGGIEYNMVEYPSYTSSWVADDVPVSKGRWQDGKRYSTTASTTGFINTDIVLQPNPTTKYYSEVLTPSGTLTYQQVRLRNWYSGICYGVDCNAGTLFFSDMVHDFIYKYDPIRDKLSQFSTVPFRISNVFDPNENVLLPDDNGRLLIGGWSDGVNNTINDNSDTTLAAINDKFTTVNLVKSDTVFTLATSMPVQFLEYEENNTSFDSLAKLIYNKNIPLDKQLKTIGSIVYNGIIIPISGIKLLSLPGDSTQVDSVTFIIDKDARFSRSHLMISLLTEGSVNPNEFTLSNISERDPNNPYNKSFNNISKMNFTILAND